MDKEIEKMAEIIYNDFQKNCAEKDCTFCKKGIDDKDKNYYCVDYQGAKALYKKGYRDIKTVLETVLQVALTEEFLQYTDESIYREIVNTVAKKYGVKIGGLKND